MQMFITSLQYRINDLHLPIANLSVFQKGVYFSGVKIFNNLPTNLKETFYDVYKFKKSLKRFPCDFDLIPKMKEPLRGIRFRTVPEILQAVDRSIRTISTPGAAKGILQLPHCWQRFVHNAGDYIEGQ